MTRPTVTLDTSCVISLLRLAGDVTPQDELSALEQIQRWGEESLLEIFVSEKSRTEAMQNLDQAKVIDSQNVARWNKWLQTLKTLHGYDTTASRWIKGASRLGIDTVLGSDEESRVYDEMSLLLFGSAPGMLRAGDVFDLAILFEHYIQKNELFVTRDRQNGILQHKAVLLARWNLNVADPVEAEQILRKRV